MSCTTSNPKTSTVPPTAASTPVDLPVLDRLERLVNNEQFADVAFRVGEVEELMFGHKVVLAGASDVFRAQFSGAFREARENVLENAIPIEDIEPATFKELLRYMYSDRAGLTMDNVVDIYYGADKYLLGRLKKTCMQFLAGNLTEMNVLRLFDRNRRYNLEEVNRVCLDIICANPIKTFSDKSFFRLAAKSVKLIASQELINCQTDQLVTAIEQWINHNEDKSLEGTEIISMVREQKTRGLICKKMHNFSAGYYSVLAPQPIHYSQNRAYLPYQQPRYLYAPPVSNLMPTTKMFTLKIESQSLFFIYGFGICIKSKQGQNPITLDVNVIMNGSQVHSTNRTVIAKEDIFIEDVLFERQTISNGSVLTITIHMHHGTSAVYCLKDFEPENPELGMRFTCNNQLSCQNVNNTDCCVYYVLYNPGAGMNCK